MVLVTPELIEPLSPDQITSVPGEEEVDPNDFDLFLMGQLKGNPADASPRLQPRINNAWPVKPEDLYGEGANLKRRGPVGPAGMEEGR